MVELWKVWTVFSVFVTTMIAVVALVIVIACLTWTLWNYLVGVVARRAHRDLYAERDRLRKLKPVDNSDGGF